MSAENLCSVADLSDFGCCAVPKPVGIVVSEHFFGCLDCSAYPAGLAVAFVVAVAAADAAVVVDFVPWTFSFN